MENAEEIENIKQEILKIKEELKEEARLLNKTTTIEPKLNKPKDWKRTFSYVLTGSKIMVFLAFMYTSAIMYNLGKPTESILILLTVALWLILNKIEGGV